MALKIKASGTNDRLEEFRVQISYKKTYSSNFRYKIIILINILVILMFLCSNFFGIS